MLIGIFKSIVDGVKDYASTHSELRKIKLKGKVEIEKAQIDAKIQQAKSNTQATTDWDIQVLKDRANSWKDEFLTYVIAAPLICSFLPWTQDAVLKGWKYLNEAPDWYVLLVIGIVSSIFGLRWLISPIANKFKGKINNDK